MNPIDLLKAETLELNMDLDGIHIKNGSTITVVNYEAMSLIDALLLRLILAQPKVLPGSDTYQILKDETELKATDRFNAELKNL